MLHLFYSTLYWSKLNSSKCHPESAAEQSSRTTQHQLARSLANSVLWKSFSVPQVMPPSLQSRFELFLFVLDVLGKIFADGGTALSLICSERLSGNQDLCLVKVEPMAPWARCEKRTTGSKDHSRRICPLLFCFQSEAGPLRSKLALSHKLETGETNNANSLTSFGRFAAY